MTFYRRAARLQNPTVQATTTRMVTRPTAKPRGAVPAEPVVLARPFDDVDDDATPTPDVAQDSAPVADDATAPPKRSRRKADDEAKEDAG